MARKRYTPETIIRKLREDEVLQGQGQHYKTKRKEGFIGTFKEFVTEFAKEREDRLT